MGFPENRLNLSRNSLPPPFRRAIPEQKATRYIQLE